MNKTENLSYPENQASVSWQEMDKRYWKMVHCGHDFHKTGTELRNPGIRNWAHRTEEFTCSTCGAIKTVNYL